MGFAQPFAWWLAAALPLVVLLNALRGRRAEYVVPSVSLWQDAPEDARANASFRRLRNPWLLLLQATALLALVGALARPFVTVVGSTASRAVIVFDVSGSMGATDVSPSRFGAARSEARDVVRRLNRDARIALIAADATPQLAMPFTSDRDQWIRGLDRLAPTDAAADLNGALRLAQAISTGTDAEIHLFTDNPPNDSAVAFTPHRFAGDGQNTAARGLSARRTSADAGAYSAVAAVANYGDEPTKATVTLWQDGAPVDAKVVEIAANGEATATLEGVANDDTDTALAATLDAADALERDNAAYAVLPAAAPLRILVVGGANAFLDSALEVNLLVTIERATPDEYLERDDVHLTVFDGWAPDELPAGDVLLIDPPGDLPFATRNGDLPTVQAVTWNRTGTLTRFADFTALSIRRATRFELSAGAVPLVTSSDGPLIAYRELGATRAVLIAFDAFNLSASDFALQPAAVVLMSNAVEWAREGVRTVPTLVTAGETVSLRGDPTRQLVAIHEPSGATFAMRESARFDRAGLYRLTVDGSPRERFAVNPAPSESDIRPANETATATTPAEPTSRREIWQWFALLGATLLTAEWWLYYRKA